MLYVPIHNPQQRTFAACAAYMLRSDSTVDVHWQARGFDGHGGMDEICRSAAALGPLTVEFGAQARRRTRPFRHAVLSLPPGEDLPDETLVDAAHEATIGLTRTHKPEPVVPMVIATHRDTPHLHAHILTVPVDLASGVRVRAPLSVNKYRSVLLPIERRLGLSSPRANAGWNDHRFHLPFKTWVRMDERRLSDVQDALLTATTWEEAMRRIARHGIRFRPTTKNYSNSTRFRLAPFGMPESRYGCSIRRDVFKGVSNAPSATMCVAHWGRYPAAYQKRLEQQAPPGIGFRQRPIGGELGSRLYARWRSYADHKLGQKEQLLSLYEASLLEIRDREQTVWTPEERRIMRDPAGTKDDLLDGAEPMSFADWVETMADRKDRDALWLSAVAADGTNVDPPAARRADIEGSRAGAAAGGGDVRQHVLDGGEDAADGNADAEAEADALRQRIAAQRPVPGTRAKAARRRRPRPAPQLPQTIAALLR